MDQPKRGRGRPRKTPQTPPQSAPPGRPRKYPHGMALRTVALPAPYHEAVMRLAKESGVTVRQLIISWIQGGGK